MEARRSHRTARPGLPLFRCGGSSSVFGSSASHRASRSRTAATNACIARSSLTCLRKRTDADKQIAFDLWRREFNDERPHEALATRPPAKVYTPSRRPYPRPLYHFDTIDSDHLAAIDERGAIRFMRRTVFISSALRGLVVELVPLDIMGSQWNVRWGPILLGRIHRDHLDRGLIPTRRRRGEVTVLSLLSDDED